MVTTTKIIFIVAISLISHESAVADHRFGHAGTPNQGYIQLVPRGSASSIIQRERFTDSYTADDEKSAEIAKPLKTEKKQPITVGSTPHEDDIVRLVLNLYAKHRNKGYAVYPDMLVKELPLLGEVARSKISVRNLSCKKDKKSKGAFCDFTVNSQLINGLAKAFSDPNGKDRNYSVKLTKGQNGWESSQLDEMVRELGIREQIAAAKSKSDVSYDKNTYNCEGGRLVNKYTGDSNPFLFHPDC